MARAPPSAGDQFKSDDDTAEYSLSKYEEILTAAMLKQYADLPLPKHGETIHVTYDDPVLMRMMVEQLHRHYDSVLAAASNMVVQKCMDAIMDNAPANASKLPKDHPYRLLTADRKQSALKLRMHHGFNKWERAMRAALSRVDIHVGASIMQVISLEDVLSVYQHQLVCTDGIVIGVDEPKLILDMVETGEKGWMPAESYEDPKKDGVIINEKHADCQTLLMDEYSDENHMLSPGVARRIVAEVRIPHVGRYKHGDKLRMYAFYMPKEEDRRKYRKHVYLNVLHVEKLSEDSTAELEPAELHRMRTEARTDPVKYADDMADSIAPHIAGNRTQKLAVILASIKGKLYGGSRDNLHVLLIDDPGTGKSELLKWVATTITSAAYVDGPNATAQGLLYGQEEFDGKKILHAGVALRNELLFIDELDKMSPYDRKKLNTVMEQEYITYNKVPFHEEHEVDLGVIAAANPHGGHWLEDRKLSLNTKPLEPSLVSRHVLSRMEHLATVDKLVDSVTISPADQKPPPYTRQQVAGMVEHCRRLAPAYDADANKTLKLYLSSFRAIQQSDNADLAVDTRKEMDVVRYASAAAKFLHRDTVDEDSINLGMRVFKSCIRSIGFSTDTPTTEMKMEDKEPKEDAFWRIFDGLADENGLVHESDLYNKLVHGGGHWNTTDHAASYVIQMMDKRGAIYEPKPNWYQRT